MVRAEPSGAKIMMAWVKEHSTVTVRYAIRLPESRGFHVEFEATEKSGGSGRTYVIEPRTIFQPLHQAGGDTKHFEASLGA